MTNANYSRTRDSIGLILFGIAFLLIAMASSGCHTQRAGCSVSRGYVGYGNR